MAGTAVRQAITRMKKALLFDITKPPLSFPLLSFEEQGARRSFPGGFYIGESPWASRW